MSSRSTHMFKSVGDLDLKVDIIYPSSCTPASIRLLYLHGGGLTGFDRGNLPPHIFQSCLLRNRPIISADYRLKPQASAQDMLEDVVSAYYLVHKRLRELLNFKRPENEKLNIILMGSSAGLCFWVTDRSKTLFNETPYLESRFAHFLTSPPRINPTPSFFPMFNSSSLLPNFSSDPTYEPLPDGEFEDRSSLFLWLVQENKLLTLWKGVDQDL
ncbi:hypothetical protein BTUL_0127g00080 [Botrytis tulipae]|uniref:Alpha/beta hydrolase fold-3 domain-containing protein n=1 Tax=Botrytis tulipae TaxID=87230 RepID=A0A4Z1EHM3_9HELO|nr:hypothetical protein BTUL_0127g00080 [Botrytis tulipae]